MKLFQFKASPCLKLTRPVISSLIILLFFSTTVFSKTSNNHTHHDHSQEGISNTPATIMGDHIHPKGNLMISYRFMTMNMKAMIDKDEEVSSAYLLTSYDMAPETMTMQMHMVAAMYSPSDWLTLMLMGNYIQNDMDMSMKMGMGMDMESSGLGDMNFSALFNTFEGKEYSFITMTSVLIPTGDINIIAETKTDDNMDTGMTMSPEAKNLPYSMQLGSGAWAMALGGTYKLKLNPIEIGTQAIYTHWLNRNSNDWKPGGLLKSNFWLSYQIIPKLSASVRTQFGIRNKIEGADKSLILMDSPLSNSSASGKSWLDLGFGLSYNYSINNANTVRFAAEYTLPLWQKAESISMNNQNLIVFAIQYNIQAH